jgi:hypothetical protein
MQNDFATQQNVFSLHILEFKRDRRKKIDPATGGKSTKEEMGNGQWAMGARG